MSMDGLGHGEPGATGRGEVGEGATAQGGSARGGGSGARELLSRALLPTRGTLEEVGDMMILTGRTISSALRPPYPYGGEFVSQFLFTLRLVWVPLLVTTVGIHYRR